MSAPGSALRFRVQARCGRARAGQLSLRGRTLTTPAFLPVGTYGAVKGVPPAVLRSLGTGMLLANAFHLHDRPGAETVAALGGLHRFMNWDGLILTDSGGYQVFSMLDIARLDDEGVTLLSPVDGRPLRLTPESMAAVQHQLDADIAMVLDHCPPLPAERGLLASAVERTTAWARRALAWQAGAEPTGQALFAIVQGGLDDELRRRSARELTALPFDGFALGGLSVGEDRAEHQAAVDRFAPLLPADRPRYLMGVGRPADVLCAIAAGIDCFDCVLPSRNGRHGTLLTDSGPIHLRAHRYRQARGPAVEGCPCPTCAEWSAGTLRHLLMAGDPLARQLGTVHNLHFLHDLVARARQAILDGELPRLLQAVASGAG